MPGAVIEKSTYTLVRFSDKKTKQTPVSAHRTESASPPVGKYPVCTVPGKNAFKGIRRSRSQVESRWTSGKGQSIILGWSKNLFEQITLSRRPSQCFRTRNQYNTFLAKPFFIHKHVSTITEQIKRQCKLQPNNVTTSRLSRCKTIQESTNF